jgi:hypothetical protein
VERRLDGDSNFGEEMDDGRRTMINLSTTFNQSLAQPPSLALKSHRHMASSAEHATQKLLGLQMVAVYLPIG